MKETPRFEGAGLGEYDGTNKADSPDTALDLEHQDRTNRTNLPAKLPIVDVVALDDGAPIPLRRWIFLNRIPAGCVVVLSGPGGAGKTTLGLQACVGAVLATEWCGSPAGEIPGPAMFFTTEESRTELRRRVRNIVDQFGIPARDLAGFKIASTVPDDDDNEAEIINPVLGAPDRHGTIQPTPLFHELIAQAIEIGPRLIVIETAAEVFAGNEIDRVQTAQFIRLLNILARRTGAGVMLLAHPSLSGISSGTGNSGSTQWINGPRVRMYLSEVKRSDDDETDIGFRDLKVIKSNYGPSGESTRLRWHSGVYIIEPKVGSVERAATDSAADLKFLELLERYTGEGRDVSHNPCSRNYAPRQFAKERVGFNKLQLERAMDRLFKAGKIKVEECGPAKRNRRIVIR